MKRLALLVSAIAICFPASAALVTKPVDYADEKGTPLHGFVVYDDAVTGKRVTFAFFPWNWDRGDGCIIRLVAMIDKSQNYRIEKGTSF